MQDPNFTHTKCREEEIRVNLKIVGLDIGPNLFDGVGTCGFTGTKELSESWRDSRRLEDSRSPRRLLLRQRVWFRLWLRFRLRFRRRLLGASSGDSACTSGRRGGGSRCRSQKRSENPSCKGRHLSLSDREVYCVMLENLLKKVFGGKKV